MSSKPKKTLSKEQLLKMQEGRKKAQEKRAKERQQAKSKAQEFTNAKKSKDKEKLLQLEMEALQQQQDRIDNLRLQVERKKQVKSKLQKIKQNDTIPEEQVYEQDVEEKHTEDVQENIKVEVIDALEDVEDKIELQMSHKETDPRDYAPNDAEYSATFQREAKKIRNQIPVETRAYYDDAIKKFDFTLSLDDNIKSMIEYVKNVVGENTNLVNNIRNKQIEKESKKEVVQKSVNENIAEQSVDSKIYKLMKMRY